MKESRLGAICGLLVPVTFTVGWLVGGLAQPASYDWTRHDISDLGAMTADQPWIYNQIGSNLTGLLLLVFALALWRTIGGNLTARIGVALIGIAAIGQFLDGFLRLDCRAIDPGCGTQPLSSLATAHSLESTVTVLALLIAPFVLAWGLRRVRDWGDLSRPTLVAGIAAIVALVALTIVAQGIGPRATATILFVWMALLAYRMLQVGDRAVHVARPEP